MFTILVGLWFYKSYFPFVYRCVKERKEYKNRVLRSKNVPLPNE